jgi:predicted HicB family RNase H-like nuclease
MENRTDYKNAWKKDHRDSYLLLMKKGHKAEIKAAANAKGKSLNNFINDAIDEHMKK